MIKCIEIARPQVEAHEGRSALVYKDHLGNNTIGVGRNLDGKGLSDSEIDGLLTNDLNECYDDLINFRWFAETNPEVQAAFLNWRFQLGGAGIRAFKNTLRLLAAGDYISASQEMLRSKWARTDTPGRAREISRIIADG